MKKIVEYLKDKKRILIIGVLLAALVCIAILLYGGKSKSIASSSTNAARSETEIKLMRVLSEINGVGKAEVMITENENIVEGVIIVCEGAYNIMTRNDILNAVKTALNVEKNNIAIYAMNK